MKRPSFQFYPGDWSANPNLKRCTFAEKGIWLEVMCLMHDQAEYGVLRWPLKEIAEAVKCKLVELQALTRKGVLKGSDTLLDEAFIYVPRSGRKDGAPVTLVPTQAGPIWYSSRMVKDEYVRTIRAENGPLGDAPKPPKGEANGAPKGPRGSSSSSSTSVISPQPPGGGADGFDRFWAAWPKHPRRVAEKQCRDKWRTKECEPIADRIVAHVEAMKTSEAWTKEQGRFIPAPLVYLNQSRWEGATEEEAQGEWHETLAGVEKKAVSLGIGKWDQTVQFAVYRQKVMAAAGANA